MSGRKWCVTALAAAIAVVAVIALLNVTVDPFGVFGDGVFDWYSYNMTNNPRSAKTAFLSNTGDKYDSFLVGCSSTSSFPTDAFDKALDAKFYNMIMYGADMSDCEKTVRYLIENHTVENIVLNVYLGNAVSYGTDDKSLTGGLHYKVSGEPAVNFYARHLFANPMYSLSKLSSLSKDEYLSLPFDVFDVRTGAYDKRKRDAEPISDINSYCESYPVFKNYPKATYTMPYIRQNAESVRAIRELCEQNGVNLITVTAPVYYDYFLYFSKQDIAEFYRTLAEASGGFWDFAVSSVSLDPRYFYDETHFRNDVGQMAAARIFGKAEEKYIPEDFGSFVTVENFESHIEGFYDLEFDDSSYTKKVPVLLYHHVDENVTSPSVVTPLTFDRQLSIINEAGFESVTLTQLYNYIYKGEDLPEKPVLITFDDGYFSNLEKAKPILEKYGFNAVVFTVGAMIGKTVYKDTTHPIIPHLSAEDNQMLIQSGVFEVASHSFDMHQNENYEEQPPYYTDMLKHDGETEKEYVSRIKEDCAKMEKALGFEPVALAFPHGKGDILTQAVLNKCGVYFTFTTQYNTPTLVKGLPQSGYMLGRYTLYEDTPKESILYFLEGAQ